jgi:two-component system chemotaxis response regulator CheB
MKLMIVDDHAGMRKKICELLAKPDVETRAYATGEEAVLAAREFQPDWIIMDVHLPRMNGFEAIEIIRTEVPRARIVVISTEDRNYLREAARAVGAEQFLSKHQLASLPQMLYGGPSNLPAA